MAYHHEAVELRYSGKPYAEVAAILTEKYKRDFRDATVRRWFMTKGILESEYLDYSKKENERRRNLILEEIKKLLPMIPAKFQQLLERVATHPFTGAKLKDENNQTIPKLDTVTVTTLKTLCEILGFKVEAGGEVSDPVDRYFERLDEEVAAEEAAKAEKNADQPPGQVNT